MRIYKLQVLRLQKKYLATLYNSLLSRITYLHYIYRNVANLFVLFIYTKSRISEATKMVNDLEILYTELNG